jgi:uncharacterized protein
MHLLSSQVRQGHREMESTVTCITEPFLSTLLLVSGTANVSFKCSAIHRASQACAPKILLSRLANPADVFFDWEGYPLYGDKGPEYLWGAAYVENGQIAYRDWWAHDYEQESAVFKSLINWANERGRQNPGMHIYHYAAYEESAIYRLLKRCPGVCEDKADDLLRNEVLVNLYAVVRHSLLIGEPRYSLKNVEHIYRSRREGEVGEVRGQFNCRLPQLDEFGRAAKPEGSPQLAAMRDYNRDDCESTAQLANWLRALQEEHGRPYILGRS